MLYVEADCCFNMTFDPIVEKTAATVGRASVVTRDIYCCFIYISIFEIVWYRIGGKCAQKTFPFTPHPPHGPESDTDPKPPIAYPRVISPTHSPLPPT